MIGADDPPTDEDGVVLADRPTDIAGIVVVRHWVMRDRGAGYDVYDYTVEYLVPSDVRGGVRYHATRPPVGSRRLAYPPSAYDASEIRGIRSPEVVIYQGRLLTRHQGPVACMPPPLAIPRLRP